MWMNYLSPWYDQINISCPLRLSHFHMFFWSSIYSIMCIRVNMCIHYTFINRYKSTTTHCNSFLHFILMPVVREACMHNIFPAKGNQQWRVLLWMRLNQKLLTARLPLYWSHQCVWKHPHCLWAKITSSNQAPVVLFCLWAWPSNSLWREM